MRLQDETMQASAVRYRTIALGEVEMFYREAADSAAPAVLLLHSFPTSSHMFCDLIPRPDTYRVIAPELPGFSFTQAPARGVYECKDVPRRRDSISSRPGISPWRPTAPGSRR